MGPMKYGEVQLLGWTFQVEVEEREGRRVVKLTPTEPCPQGLLALMREQLEAIVKRMLQEQERAS